MLQTLPYPLDILLLCETKIKLSPLTNVNLTGSGAGAGGGQLPTLPFYQEGQGGQYCSLHSTTIVTKQTSANLKAGLSNAG